MQSRSIPKIISTRTSSIKSSLKILKPKTERRSIKIKRILQDFTDRYSRKKKKPSPCSNIPQYLKRSAVQLHKYFNSTQFNYIHQRDITQIRHNADLLQKQSLVHRDRQSTNVDRQSLKYKNNAITDRTTDAEHLLKANYVSSQKWQDESDQQQINWELLEKLESKVAKWGT